MPLRKTSTQKPLGHFTRKKVLCFQGKEAEFVEPIEGFNIDIYRCKCCSEFAHIRDEDDT